MSWSIHVVKNTVKINKKVSKELFAIPYQEFWDAEDDVTYEGMMSFNGDHMEHMDYLGTKEVTDVLKKHKVKGDICFTSNEGDNEGDSWGYRFDGKGGVVLLKGELVWVPARRLIKPVKKKAIKSA